MGGIGEEGGILECYSLADFAPFFSADVRGHHRSLIGLEKILGSIAEKKE